MSPVSIEDDLQDRLKQAMKDKNRTALDAIRNVRTEIQRARTEPGFDGDSGDAFTQSVIAAYVKKLDKARSTFTDAGDKGAENAAKLTVEIDYLSQWLPDKLDSDATRAVVRQAIADTGVTDPKQAGKVIGAVMKAHRDEVDAKLVRSLIDEELGG